MAKKDKEEKGIDGETAQKIQNLQMLEQNLQSVLLQRQTFSLESAETANALNELKDSDGDVYKIIGSIMVKSKKEDLEKDLSHKKELLELRAKNLEKQEQLLREKLLKLRNEVVQNLK